MGTIVSLLSRQKAEVQQLSTVSQETKTTRALADILVKNKDHLLDVLDALRACPAVLSVYEEKENE